MIVAAAPLLLAAALAAQAPAPDPSLARARTFLEAFAARPAATRGLVTSDARIVVGDIGGFYAQFMREVRPRVKWLATCRIAALAARPGPTEAERNAADAPPWLKGASFDRFEGVYACGDDKGRPAQWRITVLLRDARVEMLILAPPP